MPVFTGDKGGERDGPPKRVAGCALAANGRRYFSSQTQEIPHGLPSRVPSPPVVQRPKEDA